MIVAAALIAALAVAPARAVVGTWTGGGAGLWDTSDTNWTIVSDGTPWDSTDGPANTALFNTVGDDASLFGTVFPGAISFAETATVSGGAGTIEFGLANTPITIDVAAAKIGTMNADITTTFAGDAGNSLVKTGAGKLVIEGNVNLADATDTNKNGSFFTVNGGGELEVTGFLSNIGGAGTNRNIATSSIGDTSGGNTVRVSGTGQLFVNDITLGSAGNDNNMLILEAPGTLANPTMRMRGGSSQLNMNSSGNSFQVLNGAYVDFNSTGGTGTWIIGANAGDNGNSILVDGAGSTLEHTNSANTVVGQAGDNNSFTISDGGLVVFGRVFVGTAGGDNNFQLITGAGSTLVHSTTGNGAFNIGETAGSNGNSFRVEDGGLAFIGSTSNSRGAAIGRAVSADDNYTLVTGAGSTLHFVTTNMALTIGGVTTGFVLTSGGDGNHLDVFDGGLLDMDNSDGAIADVQTNSTAVILSGTNSAFNLGNGAAVATAAVGGTASFDLGAGAVPVTGVVLHSADSNLNINNGRLMTSVAGDLVSGPGEVVLNGPAFFSTSANSVISSLVSGAGSLTKEGSGLLQLTMANTYSGDTTVAEGILQLDQDFLDDAADVIIAVAAMMDLAFNATDTINALSLGGADQAPGTYGATGSGAANTNDTYFSGPGVLNVLTGPAPVPAPAALPAGLALMTLIASRRRRA